CPANRHDEARLWTTHQGWGCEELVDADRCRWTPFGLTQDTAECQDSPAPYSFTELPAWAPSHGRRSRLAERPLPVRQRAEVQTMLRPDSRVVCRIPNGRRRLPGRDGRPVRARQPDGDQVGGGRVPARRG